MHEWNFFCRLLVGAPEADSGQPGVVKGGAVFKCPPESPGSCDLIQFDTKVSIIYFDLKYRFAQASLWRSPPWKMTAFICMKNDVSNSTEPF